MAVGSKERCRSRRSERKKSRWLLNRTEGSRRDGGRGIKSGKGRDSDENEIGNYKRREKNREYYHKEQRERNKVETEE